MHGKVTSCRLGTLDRDTKWLPTSCKNALLDLPSQVHFEENECLNLSFYKYFCELNFLNMRSVGTELDIYSIADSCVT